MIGQNLLSVVVVAPTLAAITTVSVQAIAQLEVPAVLLGAWVAEGSDCRSADSKGLVFSHQGAEVSTGQRRVCSLSGLRRQHETRWYLDLQCDDGSRIDLDVNLMAGRLLVAERPLGSADSYTRCKAALGLLPRELRLVRL